MLSASGARWPSGLADGWELPVVVDNDLVDDITLDQCAAVVQCGVDHLGEHLSRSVHHKARDSSRYEGCQ